MSRLDSRLLRALDDWLFPERVACLCCDAALGDDDQSGLCPGCAPPRFRWLAPCRRSRSGPTTC